MASNMTLITDGASHYCEKARWALERAGVSYTETIHVVLLHMLFTRGLGAGTSCPKLVMGRSSERVVLQESPDILRFADKNIRNEEDRLYPEDAELQKLVQSWAPCIVTNLGPRKDHSKSLKPFSKRWMSCLQMVDPIFVVVDSLLLILHLQLLVDQWLLLHSKSSHFIVVYECTEISVVRLVLTLKILTSSAFLIGFSSLYIIFFSDPFEPLFKKGINPLFKGIIPSLEPSPFEN